MIRFLYLEACINLVYNLGKEVKNNEKYMQNLNNYINNNLSNIINSKENIPNHLKYKIIKLIKKNKESWNNSLSPKDNDSDKKENSSIKKNIKDNEHEKIIEEASSPSDYINRLYDFIDEFNGRFNEEVTSNTILKQVFCFDKGSKYDFSILSSKFDFFFFF